MTADINLSPLPLHKLVCGGPDNGRNLCDKSEGGSFTPHTSMVTCSGCRSVLFPTLLDEHDALRERLDAVVKAMEIWGSLGDGVPSSDPSNGGEYSAIGKAYDAARELLKKVGTP